MSRGSEGWRAGGVSARRLGSGGGGRALEGREGERAPGARAARLDPPADQHLRRAFLGQRSCQSARASCEAGCGVAPRGVGAQPACATRARACAPRARCSPRLLPPISVSRSSACLFILRHSLQLSSPPPSWDELQVCVCRVCALGCVRGTESARRPARGPGLRRPLLRAGSRAPPLRASHHLPSPAPAARNPAGRRV